MCPRVPGEGPVEHCERMAQEPEQLLFDWRGDEEINYIPCKVCAQLANHTLPRALLENFRISSVGHSRRPQFTEPGKEGEPTTT